MIQEADTVGKEHFCSSWAGLKTYHTKIKEGEEDLLCYEEVTVQYKSSFMDRTVSLTRWAIVY